VHPAPFLRLTELEESSVQAQAELEESSKESEEATTAVQALR
jgi:hypothetical protein